MQKGVDGTLSNKPSAVPMDVSYFLHLPAVSCLPDAWQLSSDLS
jgi:hypothetical protein